MKILKYLIKQYTNWISYIDICELCRNNKYTHIELATEGGIRVCDECGKKV